jgi:hypothetical protein
MIAGGYVCHRHNTTKGVSFEVKYQSGEIPYKSGKDLNNPNYG